MSRRLLSVVAAAVLLLTASGCSSFHGLNGTDGKTWVQGDGAPKQIAIADRGEPVDFSGDDLDGKPLSLASMRGKPTVVNVWWAGCPPCRAEAPMLVGAQKELGDRAHFVGIDVRDGGTAGPKAYRGAVRHRLALVLLAGRRGAAGVPRRDHPELHPLDRRPRRRRPGGGEHHRCAARPS